MKRLLLCGLLTAVVALASAAPEPNGEAKTTSSKSAGANKSEAMAKPKQASPQIDTANLDAATIARQVREKANQERARAGLGQLAWNQQLAVAATRHSADMAQRQYFSH